MATETIQPPEKEDQPNQNNNGEQFFLEGPQPRRFELWMLLRIIREFFRGFRRLHFAGPCVTVFGSARFKEDNRYYTLGREMGAALSRLGFTVMTGGGPGIMEAANRGAKEAGGHTIGCNITLPFEQNPNPYLDEMLEFKYFFVRKTMLIKYSYAFIVLPGGVGTMDEFFEALTLIQTKKIKNFPIVLMGKDYYRPLIDYLEMMVREGTLGNSDLDLLMVTDSVDEAIAHIEMYAVKQFGLRRVPKRFWMFGERDA
jgi:uncharacterized protein (TIGR00730 family)